MLEPNDEFKRGDFPPALRQGCRVWTEGYRGHGQVHGPKQDIVGPQGGEIITTEQLYLTMDVLLYTVRWDNGQESKHYGRELYSIGRFPTKSEFLKAFSLVGKVELRVGPRGGFKSVKFRVRYDGEAIESEGDRDTWKEIIEPAAARDGVEIVRIPEEQAIREQIDRLERELKSRS